MDVKGMEDMVERVVEDMQKEEARDTEGKEARVGLTVAGKTGQNKGMPRIRETRVAQG